MSRHQRQMLRRLEVAIVFVAGFLTATAAFALVGWLDDDSTPPAPGRIPATTTTCPPEVIAEPLLICA
ncbi:MAG: hypothetical protein ACRD0A_10170 [Acidimicrobiales bacterium]